MSFWTTALEEGTIKYYQGLQELQGNEPNLVSYWNFNEGQGETINDLGVNSITGSINGATWSGDAPLIGCMDPYASNYNPDANVSNGYCFGYPENGEYSLSFGASQDHVDLGSDMDSDEEFSIATWVYIDENIIPLNGQRTFINKVNSSNGNKSIFLGSYQSKIGFTVLTLSLIHI